MISLITSLLFEFDNFIEDQLFQSVGWKVIYLKLEIKMCLEEALTLLIFYLILERFFSNWFILRIKIFLQVWLWQSLRKKCNKQISQRLVRSPHLFHCQTLSWVKCLNKIFLKMLILNVLTNLTIYWECRGAWK